MCAITAIARTVEVFPLEPVSAAIKFTLLAFETVIRGYSHNSTLERKPQSNCHRSCSNISTKLGDIKYDMMLSSFQNNSGSSPLCKICISVLDDPFLSYRSINLQQRIPGRSIEMLGKNSMTVSFASHMILIQCARR